MASVAPCEDRFYKNVVECVGLVNETVADIHKAGYKVVNPLMVQLASNSLLQYDKINLIDTFIRKSHKYWDSIHAHDEEFLREHAMSIFSDFALQSVNTFKTILDLRDAQNCMVIDQDRRNDFWNFFESYVKIAIKYIHENRQPYSVLVGSQYQPRYGINFHEGIKLSPHAQKWHINLEFHPQPPPLQ